MGQHELDEELIASLTPAEHVQDAPTGGWSAADLTDDELVDDQHIADDPTSVVLRLRGLPSGA